MPTTRNRLVALVVAGPLLAACGGGGSPSAGGADAPPWGLDSVAIPGDKASIIAAFEALPAEVAGLQRTRVEPLQVSYGPGDELFVRAFRADGLDPSVRTAARFLDGLAHPPGELQIEETALDPEGELVYVVATGTEDSAPAYLAAWGAPDSVWVFAVNADSPRWRAALAEAFVEAVNASAPRPATPSPSLPPGWTLCTNDSLGYAIGYPMGWYTTDRVTRLEGKEPVVDPVPELACSFFDPNPVTIPVPGEFPATALEVHLVEEPIEEVLEAYADTRFYRILFREDTAVAGLPAVRLELELVDGLYTGDRYECVIDLGDQGTFQVLTTRVAGFTGHRRTYFEANKAIVDQAVETLLFL